MKGENPFFKRAGVFGLGLIGGSWARALKNLGAHVTVLDTDPLPCALARDAGVADKTGGSLEDFNGCDLLILCVPPTAVCNVLPRLANLEIGLVTDVCSVKTPVMDAARGMKNFLGGHPMAGGTTPGFAASNARLFENMPYALCVARDGNLPQERVAAFENLLAQLGAKVVHMTADEHDAAVARVSHLPHAAAFALRRVAMKQPDCLKLAGRGYADTTRIAHAPAKLWADILLASPHMRPVLKDYIAELVQLSDALPSRDVNTVEKWLQGEKQ